MWRENRGRKKMKYLGLDRYDCSWLARRSTGNHKNTRELWRVTISKSIFCRQSWLSQLHQLFWLWDESARLRCRSCYTPPPAPRAPTVTLLHCVTHHTPQLWHSLRPDYVTSQSMDLPFNVKVLTYALHHLFNEEGQDQRASSRTFLFFDLDLV